MDEEGNCFRCSLDFLLRILLGILQTLTLVGGLMVGLALGWLSVDFNNCLLYTKMSVRVVENATVTLAVDTDRTEWGSSTTCSYVTYTGVCAAIQAIIWLWFYIVSSEWGNDLRIRG